MMKDRTKIAALYLRVSTSQQNSDSQATELKQYVEKRGWEHRIYSDVQSGAKDQRPALERMLEDGRKRRVDVVCVWALDRLARSLKALLILLEEFQRLNLDFICLKQDLDTSSPSGRLIFSVVGAVAEFEREILRSRVRSGMAEAKRRGQRIGRPPLRHFNREEIDDICTLRRREQTSIRGLATMHGTTEFTINKILRSNS